MLAVIVIETGLPNDLAGLSDTRRPVRAKMHIDSVAFEHWRRGGLAVLRVEVSRRFYAEDFDVLQDRAGVAINRDRAQRFPFVSRRRQPYAISLNRGRRPPSPWNRDLPAHVLGLAPHQRESAFIRMSLPCGASELGPILEEKKEGEKNEGFHHD